MAVAEEKGRMEEVFIRGQTMRPSETLTMNETKC